MDFNYEVSVFLTKISTAALSLSNMAGCELSEEQSEKVIKRLFELEQSTADFIAEMKIPSAKAGPCRSAFIHANGIVIKQIEKNQLQSKNFDELSTALKLENETLKEEMNLL